MNDLEKIKKIYKSIDITLSVIEELGNLDDFSLDDVVDEIYRDIWAGHSYLYGLIERNRKEKNNEKKKKKKIHMEV